MITLVLYFAVVSVNLTLLLNVPWVKPLLNKTSYSFNNLTKLIERNVSKLSSTVVSLLRNIL